MKSQRGKQQNCLRNSMLWRQHSLARKNQNHKPVRKGGEHQAVRKHQEVQEEAGLGQNKQAPGSGPKASGYPYRQQLPLQPSLAQGGSHPPTPSYDFKNQYQDTFNSFFVVFVRQHSYEHFIFYRYDSPQGLTAMLSTSQTRPKSLPKTS